MDDSETELHVDRAAEGVQRSVNVSDIICNFMNVNTLSCIYILYLNTGNYTYENISQHKLKMNVLHC